MFGNIPGMYTACRLALLSTHHKGGDGANVGEIGVCLIRSTDYAELTIAN